MLERAPYGFGLSQEDERTECDALELSPADHVLCIASAGEMPLSLLASGAADVTAVDIDPAQLHLVALKLAAIQALPRERALRFLGYQRAPEDERGRDLLEVAKCLPGAAARFWREHEDAARRGAIWQGRFERYVTLLIAVVRPILGARRIEGLFEPRSPEELTVYFDREIDRPSVRALFRVAFDPRVFGRGGMDPRSLEHRTDPRPVGERYFERFRAFCTATPPRENHLLQLTLLGAVLSADAVPTCLSGAGVAVIRARAERLTLAHCDLAGALSIASAGTFTKIQLSNLADWLAESDFEEHLGLCAARIARPGRLVWRALHTDRDVPVELRASLRVERELGERLAAHDRYPFYRIVPASAPRVTA